MPEGDTVHFAARRIRPALQGRVPDEVLTPHPRLRQEHWPERLAGRRVTQVEALGKHLFLRFEGGLVIHSHLRMSGAWSVLARGAPWRRSPRAAWLILRVGETDVVQFNGPLLELLTEARVRSDSRFTRLGPDIVATAPFDRERFLRRLRAGDPTCGVGDALLDQRIVAGIGNIWKSEACFAAGIDPWRRIDALRDEEALVLVDTVRPLMQQSARDGERWRLRQVYEQAGRPCPRCGRPARIHGRPQGDDARMTFWCPVCQR